VGSATFAGKDLCRVLYGDHEALAHCPQCSVDLLEFRRMAQIEQAIDLRAVPAEQTTEICLCHAPRACFLIQFDLRRCQRRQSHRMAATRRGRNKNVVSGPQTEPVILDRFGLTLGYELNRSRGWMNPAGEFLAAPPTAECAALFRTTSRRGRDFLPRRAPHPLRWLALKKGAPGPWSVVRA
jgi:hypothetical protein